MYNAIRSTQHGLIMESQRNVTDYDVKCARLMTENSIDDATNIIPVLSNTSEKYIKKIDDAFSVLADLAVDTDKITEFFTKTQFTSEFEEIPLSTPLKNVNEIGRIKPEYLVQLVKDTATTINDIVNNKIDMKYLMNHFNSDISLRVKKQLVISTKPITDIKNYVKLQEKPIIVEMDSQSIMTVCIPFLRTFAVKKRELQEEIAGVKTAINTASTMMRNYTDTANALKTKGQISGNTLNTLNYYLFNQNRLIEEVITYMVFCLITKIDAYTFNINSYTELYKKTLKYNPEGSNVYHESVYEYSMATADIDTTVNMAIFGNVSSIIDYCERTYESAKSFYENHNSFNKEQEIGFVLDQFDKTNYPYEDLLHAFDVMESGLESIRSKIKDQFASPEDIISSAGFGESLLSRYGMMIGALTNIDRYMNSLNSGKAKSAVLFEILSEMRESKNNVNTIGEWIKKVYDKINEIIKFIDINEGNEISNELVRKETLELVKSIEKDFRNFLGVVIQNIIQRAKVLEEEVFALVNALDEQVDATDVQDEDMDYDEVALEYAMDVHDSLARLYMEAEMLKFRDAKIYKEYGFIFEAEQPAATQTTTAQPEANKDPKKETSSPELKEDPSKQTTEDVTKNNQAADKAKEEQNPEKTKKLSERFKELLNKVNGFFTNVVDNFVAGFSKIVKSDKEFLAEYKDAILNRSFNGLTLKIYDYFNINSSQILKDITTLSNTLGQISESDLSEYTDMKTAQTKLLGFVKIAQGLEFDDGIRIYYKVGANKKEATKINISNTQLKTRTTEMIEFCNDYYNGGHDEVVKSINSLKTACENKVKSLEAKSTSGETTPEDVQALSNISRIVMVFTSAVLTGYRNRAHHYMFALRKLVPRTKKVKETTQEEPTTPVEGEGEVKGQETPATT